MASTLTFINRMKRRINPALNVGGILLAIVEKGTILARETEQSLRQEFGGIIKLYNTQIPKATDLGKITTCGMSIFAFDNKSVAAVAYSQFVDEVIADEEGS
jgi:chromosome partitioning protein